MTSTLPGRQQTNPGGHNVLPLYDKLPGCIRRLRKEDIVHVAQLHHGMRGKEGEYPPPALMDHFQHIFLDHPWLDEDLTSLVYEENDGRITGCIGIMPRPMKFQGDMIIAAVSHNFMVSPHARTTMAGLALARAFLDGPQDLSIAEGNNASRRIWERFGGSVSFLYSLCWTRPLRPCRYLLSVLSRRGLPAAAEACLKPLSRLADGVPPMRNFRPSRPVSQHETLTAAVLCNLLRDTGRSLAPVMSERTLSWQLQALAMRQDGTTVHKVLVRNTAEEPIGWFIYYGKEGATGQVVQAGASEGWEPQVLEHLFYHAGEQGLTALSGQFNPGFFTDLSRKFGIYHNDGQSWMLIQSSRPELVRTINAGDAFLSRLEGEWWINYIHKQ